MTGEPTELDFIVLGYFQKAVWNRLTVFVSALIVMVILRDNSQDGSFVIIPGVTSGLPNAAGVGGTSPIDGNGRKN